MLKLIRRCIRDFEDSMAAAALAQEGDPVTAVRIMQRQ